MTKSWNYLTFIIVSACWLQGNMAFTKAVNALNENKKELEVSVQFEGN